jgi:DNA-binding NarL/FixJ family response regulator
MKPSARLGRAGVATTVCVGYAGRKWAIAKQMTAGSDDPDQTWDVHRRYTVGSGPDRIRVLVADNHALFRAGLIDVLAREKDFEVVGEVADGHAAIAAVRALAPDVVLVDRWLPEPDGIETTQRIRHEIPTTAVIVMAAEEDEEALFASVEAGAAAFLVKGFGPADLVAVIRRVATGEYVIDETVLSNRAVASRVLEEFRELAVDGQEVPPVVSPLTAREVEVLDLIARGMRNREIAAALSMGEQTVKNHVNSILRKLGVKDRTDAVIHAMRQGWIRMPDEE